MELPERRRSTLQDDGRSRHRGYGCAARCARASGRRAEAAPLASGVEQERRYYRLIKRFGIEELKTLAGRRPDACLGRPVLAHSSERGERGARLPRAPSRRRPASRSA